MGEKMRRIFKDYTRKSKRAKITPFFILFICLIVISFVIYTRKYIPNEITVFNNEQKTIDFLIPAFSEIKSEDESLAVSVSKDKKTIIENVDNSGGKVTLNFLGVPIKSTKVRVISTKELIPSGESVGINIKTDGVMVLGTGVVTDDDGNEFKPWEDKLQANDIIISANKNVVNSKEDLIKYVCENDAIDFLINRDGEESVVTVTPIKSKIDNQNKIGVWVRDGTEGIGTLTYINPSTNNFGALGHGILDVDTNGLMPVKSGSILKSKVTTINKGAKGEPGELVGQISKKTDGDILYNTKHGIYGKWTSDTSELKEPVKVLLKEDIKLGEATILCEVDHFGVKEYKINIEEINIKSTDEKGMIIRITDEELLSKTNGIIQGMSGSPILQDGAIVGAVTHVFVQDPTKGYGIFIENMLSEEKNIN